MYFYFNKNRLKLYFLILISLFLISCTKELKPAVYVEENPAGNQVENDVTQKQTKTDIINLLIKNNWSESSLKKLFGSPDSTFMMYNIYFTKGLDVRSANDIVYNIVFHQNYTAEIIPGINMKTAIKEVINVLGPPKFNEDSVNVFGYEKENYYIFFRGKSILDEVSVYRRDTNFDKLGLVKFINEYNKTPKNEGFPAGKEIEKYLGHCDLRLYPSEVQEVFELCARGLSINLNYYANAGLQITIYGNYQGFVSPEISLPNDASKLKDFKNAYFIYELDKDMVFEKEKGRINQSEDTNHNAEAVSPDGRKRVCVWEPDLNGNFIGIQYLDRSHADYQIDRGLYNCSYVTGKAYWINDKNVIFTGWGGIIPENEGIHIYDLQSHKIKTIAKNYSVELVSVGKGEIVYKDSSDSAGTVLSKITYTTNKDGEIILDN